MSREAQIHYLNLQENKELKEVFPKASGEWEKDKVKFTKLYNENIKFVLDFENGKVSDNEFEDGSLF